MLITSVLNCASDRLAISSLLSCIFSGALICSVIWAFFFFCIGAPVTYRGGALGVHRGRVMLYIREGPRGSNGSCSSLSDFSHSLRYPQSNWAPLVLIPEWVGLCTFSAPVGVSPTNCPVRLGVSPAAVSTPMGVFNQRFEALFPCAGALGCVVCFAPRCSSWFIHVQMWGRGVCQPPPCGVC